MNGQDCVLLAAALKQLDAISQHQPDRPLHS